MRVTFIIANTIDTYIAARHENEHKPYKRRTVSVELSREQIESLGIRTVGQADGRVWTEEILECFVEAES